MPSTAAPDPTAIHCNVAVIGAGPAGLMAADAISRAGQAVDVFDAMPSAGRKFLLAGKGGLNLTHAEPLPAFAARYATHLGAPAPAVADWLQDFGPQAVRDWAAQLGVQTFVGTSGRVFPTEMKAAPLLRAWLHRLRQPGEAGAVPVRFHMRTRWLGWHALPAHNAADAPMPASGHACPSVVLQTPEGLRTCHARALVLALGGASWPHLGSDGAWQAHLHQAGVPTTQLRPANCGFDAAGRHGHGWTDFFATRFAGHALKNVAISLDAGAGAGAGTDAGARWRKGEFVITATGVEGSLIYTAAAALRDAIDRDGSATFRLDMLPARTLADVHAAIAHPRGRRSLSSHLKSRLNLGGVHTALLHELLPAAQLADATALAQAIKALPVALRAARPVQEAISTAGGVPLHELDDKLQLRRLPGVFCAGEMLDWEAPTGGYLLTACLSGGVRAAQGVLRWLDTR